MNNQPTQPGATTQIRINCGGPALTDASGPWMADAYFTGGNVSAKAGVPTVLDTIRFGDFTYSIPAAPGTYTVKLYLIEQYATGPGQRVFNVGINNVLVLTSVDPYKEVGPNTADVKTLTVQNAGNAINIRFQTVIGSARVAAIEVLPVGGVGPATCNCKDGKDGKDGAGVSFGRAVVERIPIPAATDQNKTIDVTLQRTPTPNSLVIAWLDSSCCGMSILDTLVASTKTVTVRLPRVPQSTAYVYTAGDLITVAYYTLDTP